MVIIIINQVIKKYFTFTESQGHPAPLNFHTQVLSNRVTNGHNDGVFAYRRKSYALQM